MHPNPFLLTCSLLLLGLSLPLALQWVGPNPWYGMKPRRPLDDPSLWYRVNAHVGRVIGLVALVGVLLAYGSGRLNHYRTGMDIALFLGVFLVGLIVSAAFAYLAI